jgi:site-specific recombinase
MSQLISSTATAQIRFAFDTDANDAIQSHVSSPFQSLRESIEKLIEANRNQTNPQIKALQMMLAAMQSQFESQFAAASISMSASKQIDLWELTALPF